MEILSFQVEDPPEGIEVSRMDEPHLANRRLPIYTLYSYYREWVVKRDGLPIDFITTAFDVDDAQFDRAVRYMAEHDGLRSAIFFEQKAAAKQIRTEARADRPDTLVTPTDPSDRWRFYIDEGVPLQVTRKLQDRGYKAAAVRRVIGDDADLTEDILPLARRRDAILVTMNLPEIREFLQYPHAGIIGIWARVLTPTDIVAAIDELAQAYPDRRALYGLELLTDWTDRIELIDDMNHYDLE